MDEIFVIDRFTGRRIREPAWGEASLRWFYPPSGVLPWWRAGVRWAAVHSRWPSRGLGWWFSRPQSRQLITPFCERFGVRLEDFIVPEGGFRSFNDFFQRHIRPGRRPVDGLADTIICPSDGRVRVMTSLPETLEVKGHRVPWRELLGNGPSVEAFKGGSAAFIRLCPMDYHRFHYPTEGVVRARTRLHGPLWSVHPWAEREMPDVWWRNLRECDWVESPYGSYVYVAIGATGVGAILETSCVGDEVERGAERGAFALGGSALVLLFPEGAVEWDTDLLRNSQRGVETYCLLGTALGHWVRRRE